MNPIKNKNKLAYLSPTSIMAWRKNKEDFYLKYIAMDKPPRMAQTQAMSVGSAFDALIKGHLSKELTGVTLDLFESQVEIQNRDYARQAGIVCFEAYKHSGALADLMLMLQGSKIKLEFTVSNDKISKDFDGGVILLGKPDAYFTIGDRVDIILDWKVNGYCSLSTTSPSKGYIKLLSSHESKIYKDSYLVEHHGVYVNALYPMDIIKDDWALQTCIYSWLMGAPLGSDFIVAIDQLVCNKDIKVAQFRSIITPDYQYKLMDEIKEIWESINSDHVFRNMTKEDSEARCLMLEERALALRSNPDFTSVL